MNAEQLDDVRQKWRLWVENDIGGAPDRVDRACEAAMEALKRGMGRAEAVAAARHAAVMWQTRPGELDEQSARSDEQNGRAILAIPEAPKFNGILDVVAADKSELGRSTLAALHDLEIHQTMRNKAFLATSGFRGRYGFDGSRDSRMIPWGKLIVIAGIGWFLAEKLMRTPTPIHLPPSALPAGFALLMLLLFVRGIYLLIFTALLAHRTKLDVAKGRLLITYGLFSTQQTVVELHWIREVQWSQTFVQKLFNEASHTLQLDTPARGITNLVIPGMVSPRDMQLLADKFRNAAQKLRQGNYYARSFIG